MPANGGAQWRRMQSRKEPSTVAVNQPAAAQLVSAFPSGLSSQGMSGNPVGQVLHGFAQAPQAVPAPLVQTVEAKASERQALPADLFTAISSSIPYQGSSWQTGPLPGMGFPMQYNTGKSTPTIPQPMISANPFDVNAEASPSQATVFPSMSSLHMALPNMTPLGGLSHDSSHGDARPSWMSSQPPSYPSAIPPDGPSFGAALLGTYMGQQLHNNMPPCRPQGFEGFGNEGTSFGSLNPVAATTQNHSFGGNPLG